MTKRPTRYEVIHETKGETVLVAEAFTPEEARYAARVNLEEGYEADELIVKPIATSSWFHREHAKLAANGSVVITGNSLTRQWV